MNKLDMQYYEGRNKYSYIRKERALHILTSSFEDKDCDKGDNKQTGNRNHEKILFVLASYITLNVLTGVNRNGNRFIADVQHAPLDVTFLGQQLGGCLGGTSFAGTAIT